MVPSRLLLRSEGLIRVSELYSELTVAAFSLIACRGRGSKRGSTPAGGARGRGGGSTDAPGSRGGCPAGRRPPALHPQRCAQPPPLLASRANKPDHSLLIQSKLRWLAARSGHVASYFSPFMRKICLHAPSASAASPSGGWFRRLGHGTTGDMGVVGLGFRVSGHGALGFTIHAVFRCWQGAAL